MLELAGRIEKADIEQQIRSNLAVGLIHGYDTKVFVHYAPAKSSCLIRVHFDFRDTPVGSFITSDVPDNFQSLGPQEYILLALWENRMQERQYPTLNEINRYYDPGNMSNAAYIGPGTRENPGRKMITPTSIYSIGRGGLSNIVRTKLPDPMRASRVVIIETPQFMQNFKDAVEREGLVAIVMEPIA